jgi:hypothetical protein
MFLVRSAFWLSVVVMLLPADSNTGDKAPRVSAFEAISAARGAVSDFSQFCDRNPDVCVTGGSALQVFGDKVRFGAKMIYGYFDDQRVGTDPAETGTLKPDDLKPAWHGRQKDTAA